MSYSKESIESLSQEQFYNLKQEGYDCDYLEFQDHFPEQFNKNLAWKDYEKDIEENMTEDEMFDIKHRFGSSSEYQEYLDKLEQDVEYQRQMEFYFEHHHIVCEKPFWKECVNKIEEALKTK